MSSDETERYWTPRLPLRYEPRGPTWGVVLDANGDVTAQGSEKICRSAMEAQTKKYSTEASE